MPPKPIQIDRDKLRTAVRKLGSESIFDMLDDAIELLPPAKLRKLATKYFDLKPLLPGAEQTAPPSLLADLKRFEKASLAGEYYESFNVNSKNYMEKSAGTTAWIADYHRLLDRCVTTSETSSPSEVLEAMDILFGLLDHIDKCLGDVIFFADEGGSWQVGVDWAKVLPVWFKVLSATAEPEDYARRVTTLLSCRCSYCRDQMLVVARQAATPLQRKALAAVKDT